MQNFNGIPSDDALRQAMERRMSMPSGGGNIPEEEPGTLSRLGNSGLAILEGLGFLPGMAWDTVQDATVGFDPSDKAEMLQREERDRELAAYRQKYDGKAFEGVTDAMGSLGYSLTTMAAGLGGGFLGGAAGTLGGPAGTIAGAGAGSMAASGTVAYRAATADMERQLYGEALKVLGREPSEIEWEGIRDAFLSEIRKYGRWEAVPEAVSNLAMVKILGPLGKKMFTGGIKGAVKKVGGLYGEELATETATQWGQGDVLAGLGLIDEAPGVAESFMEIAPATFWQTTLMAGGKKAVDAARSLRGQPETQEPGSGQEDKHDNLSQPDKPLEQSPENMPVLISDQPVLEPDEIFQEDDFINGAVVSPPSHRDFQLRISDGQTVDLLGLPQRAGEQTAHGLGGMAALAEGSGSIPMGSDSTGRGPIAPSTNFSTPVTTPYRPRMALSSGGQGNIMPGVWAGLSSQRASAAPQFAGGQPLEMAEGLGGVWSIASGGNAGNIGGASYGSMENGKPSPQPSPATGGGIQLAPRADTMSVAEGLGIPAPNPMPVETQSVRREGLAGYPQRQESIPVLSAGQSEQNVPIGAEIKLMRGPRSMLNIKTGRQELLRPGGYATYTKVSSDLWAINRQADGSVEAFVEDPRKIDEIESAWKKENLSFRPTLPERGDSIERTTSPFEEKQSLHQDNLSAEDNVYGRMEKGAAAGSQRGAGKETFQGQEREKRADGTVSGKAGNRGRKVGQRQTSIKIPNRDAEPASYELVEADEVQASHLPEYSFEKNPRYELENERRYHDEAASRRKVLENAARLDPDFVLKDSVDANNGAPVVDREGNVLGGNGRAMSIRQAYLTGGERAEAYRSALKERAAELGMNPDDVDALQRPMLIRRLERGYSRKERQSLVTAMNDSFTDSKNTRASGKTRGDRLSGRSLEMLAEGLKQVDTLRQYFDEPDSRDTVEQMIRDGVILPTERNAYVGSDGLLNPDGKRVVEEALRGRIARNYEALAKLPADVMGKLDAVIPSVLIAERAGGEWNITEQLRDTVDLLAEFRASGAKEAGVFLGQVNMLTGKTPNERYSAMARQLFTLILEEKKAAFAERFRKYAAQARIADGLPGSSLSAWEAKHKYLRIEPETGMESESIRKVITESHDTEGGGNAVPEDDSSSGGYGSVSEPDTVALARHFADAFLSGKKYGIIVEARREAGSLLGGRVQPAGKAAKAVDEAIELGVTLAARRMIADMKGHRASVTEIYRALVDLYRRQPRLGVRTSTSVAQQAYSTPAPIAYLASRLAGIHAGTRVYEPTAGNGMLLIEADPKNTTANELNADRAARLRSQGFTVSERDAVEIAPQNMDVVIANPPFGRVRDNNNQTMEFSVNGLATKELDHAIVAKALGALKENGRAVLIIGGKQGEDVSRSKKYRAADQVQFWGWLFEHYNVLEHFSIDGKLYERQGASYPIDIIVLDNSGPTRGRLFPGAALPRVYTSFTELEEVLHEQVVDTAERESGHERGTAGGLGGRYRQRGQSDFSTGREIGEADSGSGRSGRDAEVLREEPGELRHTGLRNDGREGAGKSKLEGNLQRAAESRNDVSSDTDVRGAGGRGQADLSPEVQQRESGERGGRDDAGGLGRRSDTGDVRPGMGLDSSSPVAKKSGKQSQKLRETVFQVPYEPASDLSNMGTLVPRNMATAVNRAMDNLEKRHGDIDTYVADQLGYPVEQLGDYFAAEQVDALALAISNISEGSGFIIGDQTGIGKGRVNAGIIRWAKRQGYIPVFITMKPDLYADMVRDLSDIGMEGFNPLPTNTGLSGKGAILLPDGRTLKTGGKGPHEKILRNVMENGLGEYDAVFTTYDQLNPVNSQDTFRRSFLMEIAPQAVFILDESHNAGGQANTRKKASDADDRAQFVRKMLKASRQGAFYSSATYAKRPDVMSLYFKTDMQYAAEDMGKLAEAIERGGIPMQQVVAAELTETGQYLRRERSFEGAEVQTVTVEVDKSRAEKCAEIMRAIMAFDEAKEESVKKLDKEAAGEGGSVSDSGSTGKKGASSTNFTAIMHNVIAQSLLAQKIDAVVDAVEKDVKRGEKVVITLANTMGSMIGEHAAQNGIAVGAPIHFTFNDMFRRYLEKSRLITIKTGHNKEEKTRRLTDEELGSAGVRAFNAALQVIDSSDFGGLPVSIIDRMLSELEARGIRADEITGRTERIDYSTNPPTYARRMSGPSERIRVVDAFNSGEIDVVILNQSGSTGISLHSSERFKDQRRRNMIIAQPEANIDVFMQTLGRVFRTGQVVPPTYQLILSDLPAEKRPAAVLAKKMSSLNANTTASRDSDTTFKNIPDFLNKHGDSVAAQVMEDNPELHRKMGAPLKDFSSTEDAMRKVTGRIPLLSVAEQRRVYELLESEYNEYIAQLEAMGGTGLEAKSLPLDARLIEEVEIVAAKDVGKNTPFAGSARLGTYDVKKLGKPWPAAKVKEMVQAAEIPDMAQLRHETLAWHKEKARDMSVEAADKQLERLKTNYKVIYQAAEISPGSPVLISGENMLLEGILIRLYHKGGAENPLALGAWKMDIALPDAARKITIPLSQTARKDGAILVRESHRDRDALYELFDSGQSDSREKAYIITGNILAAYQKVGKGNVITFQDNEGNTIPGIMLPRDTRPEEISGSMDVSLSPETAIRFLEQLPGKGTVKTADKLFSMTYDGGGYNIFVPSSKAKGAQYFLNGAVLSAAGMDFVKSGQSMVLRNISEAQALGVMQALSGQGYGFVVDNNRETARKLTENPEGRARASLSSPGRHLPPRRTRKVKLRVSAVRGIAAKLNARAQNAAPVRVVQTAEELPAHVRELFVDQLDALEGIYDPASGTVWLVADNISDTGRAADVWAHEQIVHHGLRGLFSEGERKRILNGLWQSMGGMGNRTIRQIAEAYELNPLTADADRLIVMEEVVAYLAGKRQSGRQDATEQSLWRKIIHAVLRAWNRLVRIVSGRASRMEYQNIDELLADLGDYIWDGRKSGSLSGLDSMDAMAFAARRNGEEVQYKKIRIKDSPSDIVLLPDGSENFGIMPEITLNNGKRLKSAPLRLLRGISSFGRGKGLSHIEDAHGDDIRALGYPNAQAFVWELVNDFDEIWAGTERSLTLVRNRKSGKSAGFIELEKNNEFYEIKSAFPVEAVYPQRETRRLLWRRDDHATSATDERNPFLYQAKAGQHASIKSEETPQRQWGQSNEEGIAQAGEGDKPLASLSRRKDRKGEEVQYKKIRIKDSPSDIVLLPDGSENFGIMPEITLNNGKRLKSAPIRLKRGRSFMGGGSGLAHIEDVHGEEIRQAGYSGVQEFVWDLINGFDEIWEGTGGSLTLVRSSRRGKQAGFIELEKQENYYEIKSAFPVQGVYPQQKTRKLLWKRHSSASTATDERNPFLSNNAWLGRASIKSEDAPKSQRGQSNKESIAQAGEGDKPLASLSRRKDRKGLSELIAEWSEVSGRRKEALHRELREHFGVDRIDNIPNEWMKDAEDFVRERIDAIPEEGKPGFLDRLFTLGMKKTADVADAPEVRKAFNDEDLGMFRRFVSLPHWIAKKAPAFAKVYERQLRRMDERSVALKKSLEEVPSLFGKKHLGKADMESLVKILWETEGREPKELEGIEKFLKKDTLPNGRETIRVNPAFYTMYDRWVSGLKGTEAAKKALMEIRRSLDNDLVLAHNRMAAMSEMGDDAIREFRQSIGHVPNYFPHHRYGKYYVQAKVGGEVVYRRHFDAAGDARAKVMAERIAAEEGKKYPGAKWTYDKNRKLPDEVLGAPIDTEAMEQIIRAATAKIGDAEQARKIAGLLTEGTADVLKARGWGEHGIRRKGVPGFEKEDLARVLYDYKAGLNGWLTKMEAARDFGDALREIDARETPQVWEYTSQYVKDMLRNSDRIDRISGNIKSVAFAWYLGGSIKTAMVNLTQNFIVGIPRLQMDVTEGASAWLRGAHRAIAYRVTGEKAESLSDEEARLLRELYGESVITDAYMEEIRGQLGSTSGNLWNRFTRALGWPMSEVEKFNRASLALAAFRAARAGQMKDHAKKRYGVTGRADYEQAKAFASEIVRDSHFVYGKSNMPEFMRSSAAGRAMSSMFTFRSFTFNMVGMWAWALGTQGREGAKFMAKSLGATLVLGGVTALPFYATLMALCQMISGDDDDWTEQIRKAMPESNLLRDAVCYGLPSLVGVNIGGSLQMETGLTRGLQRGTTPKEVLSESFGDLVGIPYDLFVEKPSKVMEASRYGDVWRMMEEASPVLLRNTMQALRLYAKGQTTMSGRPVNDPGVPGARKLTGAEAVGKAFGFQPVSSTKSYAAYAARERATEVRGDMVNELTVLYLKSREAGSRNGMRGMLEMRGKLREWNERMKAEGKPHMIIRMKDILRRASARRRENRITSETLRARERHLAAWG